MNRSQELAWLQIAGRTHGSRAQCVWASFDVPGKVPVAAGRQALLTLVQNHEILRTVFLIGPDGAPVQIVLGAEDCVMPVETIEAGNAAPWPVQDDVKLVTAISIIRFPWRVRLFHEAGILHHANIVCDHIISDGHGLRAWRDQFLSLCQGREIRTPTLQPIDRALLQRQQASDDVPAVLLEEAVNCAPQTIAPPLPAASSDKRFLECDALYPELMDTLDVIVAEHRVSRPLVLLFALSTLVASYSRLDALHAVNQVHNRAHADAGIDTCVTCPSVLVKLPPEASLREAMRTLHRSFVSAMYEEIRTETRYADRMLAAAARRGISGLFPMNFNYLDAHVRPNSGSEPIALRSSVREDTWHIEGSSYELHVRAQPVEALQTAGRDQRGIALNLQVDTSILPLTVLHTMVDYLPPVLQLMAAQPDASINSIRKILPAEYGPPTSQRLVHNAWIDLKSLEKCLRAFPAVTEVRVGRCGQDVIAHIRLDPKTNPFDVHEHVLASLVDDIAIRVPDVYRITTDVALMEWRPGTQHDRLCPHTPGERTLALALARAHGFEFDDMSRTYAQAGGQLIRHPAVAEALCREGWTGLTPRLIRSPVTLRTVARALHPPPPLDPM